MATHELKTWPEYFAAVLDESKTFEIRKDDREFQVGDMLHLREYDPGDSAPFKPFYSGRECFREITYILRGDAYLPRQFAALAIKPVNQGDACQGPFVTAENDSYCTQRLGQYSCGGCPIPESQKTYSGPDNKPRRK